MRYGHLCKFCKQEWAADRCSTTPRSCSRSNELCPPCGGWQVDAWHYVDDFANWVADEREKAGIIETK
jgi:hypothetical protein